MTVERIFRQLADRGTWPPAPARPARPATAQDLRPATLVPASPEDLQPWTPAAEITAEGWPGSTEGHQRLAEDCGGSDTL